MANKKNKQSDKQKAASLKNMLNWNKEITDVQNRSLNIQAEISTAMEKQLLTGKKITTAERKNLDNLQTILDNRIKTENQLGRSFVLSKQNLKLKDDELKMLQKITNQSASTTDLYKEYLLLQYEDSRLKDTKKNKDKKQSIAIKKTLLEQQISYNRVRDINKEISDEMESRLPIMKKMKDMATSHTGVIAGVAGGLTLMAKDWNEQLEAANRTFGAMGPEIEAAISSKMQKANKEMAGLDISFREVAGYVGTIAEKFGVSITHAVDMAYNTAEMSKSLGVSGEELIELENIYVNIVGLSRENADLTLKQQMSWLETAGVVPQAVLRDMSRNTEVIARYTSHMSTNLLNASFQANKLGVSLSTIDKMSGSVLNFQQSIRDEFELSVLLGTQMDLRTARAAFLNKDMAGGLSAIRKELGGIDLKSLDALTVEKLASTFQLSYEELNKLINNGGKLDNLEKATTETLQQQNTERIKASEAQTKVTEAMNLTKNVNRLMNEQMVENWGKIEAFAKGYSTILKGVTGIIAKMGILNVAGALVVAAIAKSWWSVYYARLSAQSLGTGFGGQSAQYTGGVAQGASRMAGSGGFIPTQMPRGITSWRGLKTQVESQGGRYTPGMWNQYKSAGLSKTTPRMSMSPRARFGGAMGLGIGAMALGAGKNMLSNPQGLGGDLMGVGSSALTGASLGMLFGPVGAAIGGALGAGYGALTTDWNNKPLSQGSMVPSGGIRRASARSAGSGGNEIDYEKFAKASEKGFLNAIKKHGVPSKTDEQIWRQSDKAIQAWGS